MRRIKFGVRVPNLVLKSYFPLNTSLHYRTIEKYTVTCEALGYDSIWVNDHLLFGEQILESWTLLSALSSSTHKIRLGTLVLCNNFRAPSVLAKMAATLDYISKGRLEFGIGAGWNEWEHRAYGLPLPKPKERLARLSEALEIVKRMWTETKPSFHGKYYIIKEAICEPKPLQKPHPPILVGSSGRQALKLVAQYADTCNFAHQSPQKYRESLSILREHCREIGRSFDTIEKSLWSQVVISEEEPEIQRQLHIIYQSRKPKEAFNEWARRLVENNIIGSPDECINKLHEYQNLGVSLFLMRFGDAPNLKGINLFAKKVASVFQ